MSMMDCSFVDGLYLSMFYYILGNVDVVLLLVSYSGFCRCWIVVVVVLQSFVDVVLNLSMLDRCR